MLRDLCMPILPNPHELRSLRFLKYKPIIVDAMNGARQSLSFVQNSLETPVYACFMVLGPGLAWLERVKDLTLPNSLHRRISGMLAAHPTTSGG